MSEIKLTSIFDNIVPSAYKVHFARTSDSGYEPLNDYIKNFEEWKEWNTYDLRVKRYPHQL